MRDTSYFVSYAHRDSKLVQQLLELLTPLFKTSRAFRYLGWIDRGLVVGEKWHERIQTEIAASDFGMIMVSPDLLASDYITANELPFFVGSGTKPIVPIGLKPIDSARQDLKGLADHQIFRLDRKHSFSELVGARREAFALQLFGQIEDRIGALRSHAI